MLMELSRNGVKVESESRQNILISNEKASNPGPTTTSTMYGEMTEPSFNEAVEPLTRAKNKSV